MNKQSDLTLDQKSFKRIAIAEGLAIYFKAYLSDVEYEDEPVVEEVVDVPKNMVVYDETDTEDVPVCHGVKLFTDLYIDNFYQIKHKNIIRA